MEGVERQKNIEWDEEPVGKVKFVNISQPMKRQNADNILKGFI